MKVKIELQSGFLSSCNGRSLGYFELILGTVLQGKPGKSAYEYAKEGGYTGTEKQFYQALSLSVTHEKLGNMDEVITE